MSRFHRRPFSFWAAAGSVLALTGWGIAPRLQRHEGEVPTPAAHVSPTVGEKPDDEELWEFARNPVQYHLIPRLQGRSLPPPSWR